MSERKCGQGGRNWLKHYKNVLSGISGRKLHRGNESFKLCIIVLILAKILIIRYFNHRSKSSLQASEQKVSLFKFSR